MPRITDRRPLAAAAVLAGLAAAAAPASAADMHEPLFGAVEIERLEYQASDQADTVAWEAEGRYGGDTHKVAVKTEGEYDRDAPAFEKAEGQLLYQRMVSEFFDLQVGVRHDLEPDPERTHAVLGITGLAPHWVEVDAALFLSETGDASARLDLEYDLLLTQSLVLQPAVEVNVAFSDDTAAGVYAGVTGVEAGLRLRYELTREVAPYVGVAWERAFGKTADHIRAHGEDPERVALVGGLRISF